MKNYLLDKFTMYIVISKNNNNNNNKFLYTYILS